MTADPRSSRPALQGSGKSSLLRARIPDLDGYRVIDADIIKDYLIEQALDEGIYDHLLAETLADGHTLAPRELAALVQALARWRQGRFAG